MKKLDFLSNLIEEEKLKLVEPSTELCAAYLEKSADSLKASKILLSEKLFEISVTDAYYAMYHAVIGLLFRCGIKCENHSAAVVLLDRIFFLNHLSKILGKAKKERIDKQYYLTDKANIKFTRESAQQMIIDAEHFTTEIRVFIGKLNSAIIVDTRKKFIQLE